MFSWISDNQVWSFLKLWELSSYEQAFLLKRVSLYCCTWTIILSVCLNNLEVLWCYYPDNVKRISVPISFQFGIFLLKPVIWFTNQMVGFHIKWKNCLKCGKCKVLKIGKVKEIVYIFRMHIENHPDYFATHSVGLFIGVSWKR